MKLKTLQLHYIDRRSSFYEYWGVRQRCPHWGYAGGTHVQKMVRDSFQFWKH